MPGRRPTASSTYVPDQDEPGFIPFAVAWNPRIGFLPGHGFIFPLGIPGLTNVLGIIVSVDPPPETLPSPRISYDPAVEGAEITAAAVTATNQPSLDAYKRAQWRAPNEEGLRSVGSPEDLLWVTPLRFLRLAIGSVQPQRQDQTNIPTVQLPRPDQQNVPTNPINPPVQPQGPTPASPSNPTAIDFPASMAPTVAIPKPPGLTPRINERVDAPKPTNPNPQVYPWTPGGPWQNLPMPFNFRW